MPLQPQPARVLTLLVERADRLVSRSELREAVWGEATHVDFDRGLNYCIRHLRAALGDDAKHPRFIETVARRGYRFVAAISAPHLTALPQPASPLAASPLAASPQTASPQTAPPRRRRRLIIGVEIAAALLVMWLVESGGRNESHHDMAVAVARIVHDLLF